MYSVTPYREEQFDLIKSWWDAAGEFAALPGMMPEDSTLIVNYEGRPLASLTIYFTNSKEIAYLENLVGNPEFKGEIRKKGVEILTRSAEQLAKSRGYKRLLCLTEKTKLKGRYEELGYLPTLNNVTTFVREL